MFMVKLVALASLSSIVRSCNHLGIAGVDWLHTLESCVGERRNRFTEAPPGGLSSITIGQLGTQGSCGREERLAVACWSCGGHSSAMCGGSVGT